MPLDELLSLAHALADPRVDMAILAEGNVSARADEETFWIKGSGQEMLTMEASGFSRVRLGTVWAMLHERFDSDEEIRRKLNQTVVEGPPPSTEAFMHAALLALPGVNFVGHVHPTPLLSLLCLERAKAWAEKRLFPDEIVCCGPATCFIPYVAPGLELARSIQRETELFRDRHGVNPKNYWLQNHGLIATGATRREVEAGCLMAVKAARVLLGALQSGKDIRFLTDDEVGHIYRWPDEHARQRALWSKT